MEALELIDKENEKARELQKKMILELIENSELILQRKNTKYYINKKVKMFYILENDWEYKLGVVNTEKVFKIEKFYIDNFAENRNKIFKYTLSKILCFKKELK